MFSTAVSIAIGSVEEGFSLIPVNSNFRENSELMKSTKEI